MYSVEVFVTYKKSILDPQGTAVQKIIDQVIDADINDVRIDKFITFTIKANEDDVNEIVDSICDQVLINPNMEEYRYELKKVENNS
ncbi:phosphoribosylformylglycinamidine synthase subunit PurS [Companilactobacillus sp. RD055328]|uniref:phosphoribosylformylglycinamidine synthase subunit PurS n=1 Tax=Companilactobacillus sp. RD055328 TaxID=2916634 RepID=UPI001FC7EFB0|nr:phosphoribosylformylglycinamidine synthase subunit PurS [Companilactobacillus sp. RD055328]GKQ42591.1 phosphoribosylformylglycinamidine synthase subunit PurS [Companilactobacillus sp. RD055328]